MNRENVCILGNTNDVKVLNTLTKELSKDKDVSYIIFDNSHKLKYDLDSCLPGYKKNIIVFDEENIKSMKPFHKKVRWTDIYHLAINISSKQNKQKEVYNTKTIIDLSMIIIALSCMSENSDLSTPLSFINHMKIDKDLIKLTLYSEMGTNQSHIAEKAYLLWQNMNPEAIEYDKWNETLSLIKEKFKQYMFDQIKDFFWKNHLRLEDILSKKSILLFETYDNTEENRMLTHYVHVFLIDWISQNSKKSGYFDCISNNNPVLITDILNKGVPILAVMGCNENCKSILQFDKVIKLFP